MHVEFLYLAVALCAILGSVEIVNIIIMKCPLLLEIVNIIIMKCPLLLEIVNIIIMKCPLLLEIVNIIIMKCPLLLEIVNIIIMKCPLLFTPAFCTGMTTVELSPLNYCLQKENET